MAASYSTKQVAELAGIDRITLERWLTKGKVARPKVTSVGEMTVRLWNDRDVERVKKYKAANYRKGRGRKKQSAS